MSITTTAKEQERRLVEDKAKFLFVDPKTNNYLSFFSQFKIIIRPNVIWELLVLFENFDDDIKSLILSELRECLEKFPLNSLTLATKTIRNLPNNKSQNVIELFIALALKTAEKNPKMVEELVDVISLLCRYNKLEKSHLNVIYSDLSTKFYNQKLDSDSLFNSITILRKILISQNPKFDEPQSFFYFTGLNSSLNAGLKHPLSWSFGSGFALGVWFYIDDANEAVSSSKVVQDLAGKMCPKLFTIHCQGSGGFEAYFLGNELYYRILPINYSEPAHGSNGVPIGVFQPKTWYYLGLEHERQKMIGGRSYLNIVINAEFKKTFNIEFPKIASKVQITKFAIGENLIGRISSIVFFKTPIGQAKLTELHSLFSLGIQANNTIRNFHISMEKFLGSIFLLYTPIRAVGDICFDIFGNHHGVIQSNAGVISRDYTQFRFGSLGGVTSILPFFYYLRFIDNEKYPNILDELLKILILLFRNKPDNQVEAIKIGFFKVVGQLISETDKNLLTTESIELLAELKNSLNNPKLAEDIFVGILWKTEIYDNASEETLEQALKYIRTIYLQNSGYNFSLFTIKNIIDLMIDKYDVSFKKKAVLNSNKEWNCTKTPEFKAAEKTFKPFLNIIEVALFTGGEVAADALNSIINILTFKCSPYLHLLLLQLLKSFVGKKNDPGTNAKTYLRLLSDTRSIKNLLYLMTNTSCLDLKSMCIKFLNILTTYVPAIDNEHEIAQYISGVLYSSSTNQRDKDFDFEKSSLLSEADKKEEDLLPVIELQKEDSDFQLLANPDESQESMPLDKQLELKEKEQAASRKASEQLKISVTHEEDNIEEKKEEEKEPKLDLNNVASADSLDGQTPLSQNLQEVPSPEEQKIPQVQSEDSLKPKEPEFKSKSLRKKPVLKPLPIEKSPATSPPIDKGNSLSKLDSIEGASSEKASSSQDASASVLEDSKTTETKTNTLKIPLMTSSGLLQAPSSAMKSTLNTGNLTFSNDDTQVTRARSLGTLTDEPAKTPLNEQVSYSIMYTSLLEWLLHKEPAALVGSIMIDDIDKIKSVNTIHIIIKFYKFANESIKQKIIQDMFMLVKWNAANSVALLGVPEFLYFLLDVLYNCQLELFHCELRGVPAGIWELGVKTWVLLYKHAMINEPEGHQHLQLLFAWATSKRIGSAKNPDRAIHEKAANYLIRHLWINLLEALEDNSNAIYPSARSNLWNNLIQITFYTEELIISSFGSYVSKLSQMKSDTINFSPLRNFITELPVSENVPYNFKAAIKKSLWVDYKTCEALLKVVKPLWAKFALLNFKEDEKLSQTQKIEKKLNFLMDTVQAEEQSRMLEFLFVESKEKDFPSRGSFLKTVIQILICYTEQSIRESNNEGVFFGCEQIENMLTFLLIIGENVRDKNLQLNRKNFIMASILYLLKLLYQLLGILEGETEIKKAVISTIRNVILHLMCIIDYINLRPDSTTSFSPVTNSFQSTPSKDPPTAKSNFTLITSEIAFNYFTYNEITIQMIKTMKFQDFAPLGAVILSQEWRKIPTENTKANQLISEHYKTSLQAIMVEMSRKMEDRSFSQALKHNRNEKKNEESQKKYGVEIVETALEIYEQEDYKRQETIATEEEYIRSAKNSWKKVWKRMRTYVGQWRHPLFYDQEDNKFNAEKEAYNNTQKNPLFTHKISKYEIKSRARPFLKVKLIEPVYVEQYNDYLSKKREHVRSLINALSSTVFFNQNVLSDLPNSTKRFSFGMLGRGLKKTFKSMIPIGGNIQSTMKTDTSLARIGSASPNVGGKPSFESPMKQETLLTKKCQWLKTLTIRNGFIQISSNKLSFIVEGLDQKENHVAFLKHTLPEDRKIAKEWLLENIREIQRRRYIFRKSALEVFFTDGSSLLLNFGTEADAAEIVETILKIKKIKCPSLMYHGTLDPRKIIDKAGLTKKWQNYEMSNFAYLMNLNALSGRSYKDLTQYPVFPWIIKNYIAETIRLTDPSFFRDLSKSLGALGSQERINTFVERFENTDTFDPVPAFHFGSHYSSPAIILQYLVRLAPFTQGAIQLQSGRFDIADRLFYSMQESYRGATEEIADVRELIPEFFFLPDFLINREKLDFGITQHGLRVDHVTTPKWSENNPYLFVALLREALESEIVSRSLHNWIDLIWGYKQTGPEAEKNLNVFFYMTYEDKVDLNMLEDPATKISYESQIVHFGQTPTQLFTKPHPPRPLPDSSYKILAEALDQAIVYRPPAKNKDDKSHSSSLTTHTAALIKMSAINETRLIAFRKDGRVIYYKWQSSAYVSAYDPQASGPFRCSIEREKIVRLDKGKDEMIAHLDSSVAYITYPVLFLNLGKIMVFGGYWDGRLSLYSLETETPAEVYYNHSDTITAIATDDKEKYLISGTKSGECILWKFAPEINKLHLKFQYYDHEDMITHIVISTDMRLFATAGNDGRINIYHLITGQLMRTIYHPSNLAIGMVILSSCPLPCVIFFSSEDRCLYSYSINGRLLETVTEDFGHALSPLLIKDINFMELLVYGNEKGELLVRELPFLNLRKKWEASYGSPLLTIMLLKDYKYLVCGCGDGDFSVVTDPNIITTDSKKSDEDASKIAQETK